MKKIATILFVGIALLVGAAMAKSFEEGVRYADPTPTGRGHRG